ncbi:MAG TPA: hypothetical protein VF811_12910 [Parasulfuritortus sp.]
MVTDRIYRVMLGAGILAIEYFNLTPLLYVMIATLVFEGLTNIRLPFIANRLLGIKVAYPGFSFPPESEQAWRLVMAIALTLSGVVFVKQAWFVPWFLGFVILGAGISEICPGLILLRASGCRN